MASMTPYTLPVLKPPTAMGSCRWSLVLSPTGGSPTTASRNLQGTSEGKRAQIGTKKSNLVGRPAFTGSTPRVRCRGPDSAARPVCVRIRQQDRLQNLRAWN
ncbi:hypothetical protein E4U47_000678 [Claviceps purpurea]|nr:hypothetical protein E4U47_000678 [Claviceps purpurea]